MKNDLIIQNRVVVFTDIHHFMIAASVLKSEQCRFLQEFYEIMGEIVVDKGGELIKYLGDGFLCIYPEDLTDAAVSSALEMRKGFPELIKRWKLPPDTELEVGISGGEIAEGLFGHKSLRQKDIFGDIVNQAAIIGHHRGIAITEWIYKKISKKHPTLLLPDVKLKWLDNPMKVWEVVEQS
jgi:adenylate cyclase